MNGDKFRLLIVEDNEDDVLLLLRELKKAGYDVHHEVVYDESALRQALSHARWDCVTSDHVMPQFTGKDAVRVVREMAPELPLVIVSGELDIHNAVDLLKCGADDYVHKDELSKVVNAIEAAGRKAEISKSLRYERKRLQERERIFRSYFDLPVVGAAVLTPDRRVIEANSYLGALLQTASELLVGTEFPTTRSPETERISGLFARLAMGKLENIDTETSLVRLDGSLVPVRLSAHYYKGNDEAPDYILCLVVDQSREALLQRQVDEVVHLIDTVSKRAPMAFYLLNCRTKTVEYASDKVCRMLRVEPSSFKPIEWSVWSKGLHSHDLGQIIEGLDSLSRMPDGQTLVMRFRLSNAEGNYRSFLSENTVYKRDEHGLPLIAFGVFIEDPQNA